VHTVLEKKLADEEMPPPAIVKTARDFTHNAAAMLHYEARAALSLLPVDGEHLRAATFLLSRTMVRTGRGQGWDMLPAGKGAGSEHALRVAMDKTAHYTMVGPLQFGAKLAGAPVDSLAAFDAYGLPAGVAFQLQDDLIGIGGNAGKDAMPDIRDGKETVLLDKARKRATPAQLAILAETVGNASLSERQFQDCLAVLRDTGAVAIVQDTIRSLTMQAVEAIPAEWPAPQADFLRGVAIYGGQRKK